MTDRIFSLKDYSEYVFHSYDSLASFLANRAPEGIAQILIGDQYLHALFVDRQAETTLVHFGAALPPRGWDTYPHFLGRRSGMGYKVNHLLLSDPNYGLPGRLPTGWFGGSEHQDLQRSLAEVIQHYSANGITGQLVLFGSSAGGFASLYYGSKLPDSVSIAVNPRTDLRNKPTQYYRLAPYAFSETAAEDLHSRIDVSVGEHFSNCQGNTVAYIQNVRDDPYFENNLLPFLELNANDERIWLNLIDSGPGHVIPGGSIVSDLISALIVNAPNWHAAMQRLGYKNYQSAVDAMHVRAAMTSER